MQIAPRVFKTGKCVLSHPCAFFVPAEIRAVCLSPSNKPAQLVTNEVFFFIKKTELK